MLALAVISSTPLRAVPDRAASLQPLPFLEAPQCSGKLRWTRPSRICILRSIPAAGTPPLQSLATSKVPGSFRRAPTHGFLTGSCLATISVSAAGLRVVAVRLACGVAGLIGTAPPAPIFESIAPADSRGPCHAPRWIPLRLRDHYSWLAIADHRYIPVTRWF